MAGPAYTRVAQFQTTNPATFGFGETTEAPPFYDAVRLSHSAVGERSATVAGITTTQAISFEVEFTWERGNILDGLPPASGFCRLAALGEYYPVDFSKARIRIDVGPNPDEAEIKIGTETIIPPGTSSDIMDTPPLLVPEFYYSTDSYPLRQIYDRWGFPDGLPTDPGTVDPVGYEIDGGFDWRDLRHTFSVEWAEPVTGWDTNTVVHTFEWELLSTNGLEFQHASNSPNIPLL